MKNKYIILMLVMALGFGGVHAQDWEQLNSGTQFHLYQINFPPNQNKVGYAAGTEFHGSVDAPGIILKTTDSGDTWTQIYPKSGADYVPAITCVWFVNENVGYAGVANSLIKTTDGGQTWAEVTNLPDNTNLVITFVEFYNENTGIVQALREQGGDFYITRDGGASWTKANTFQPVAVPIDVAYIDETHLQCLSQFGDVWTSEDAGINWTQDLWLPMGTTCLDFSDGGDRVVGAFQVVYYRPYGEFFNETKGAGLGNWNDVLALDNGVAYAVGPSEHIFGTEDGGKLWNDQLFVEDDGKSLNSIDDASEGMVFVCGDEGRIYRKKVVTTSIDNPKIQLVNRIYPVPALNEINIDFKGTDNKTIVIYNQLGTMVMKCSSVLDTKAKLDISTLVGGHYIISIQTKDHVENIPFIKQ
ncbi:MAG: YCF48-related protein [Carboxylicivirga sp.]|nr:YCF48-related protein [Carboxylicivirga sp.]